MTIIQTDKPLDKRHAHDYYPTPRSFCDKAVMLLGDIRIAALVSPGSFLRILDPGCATGVWGQAAQAHWGKTWELSVDGVEIRDVPTPEGYRYLFRGDFCLQDVGMDYHLVIGNPPFSHGEIFVKQGLANLVENGYLLYLLRLSFLEGKGRKERLFRSIPPRWVYIAGRVSFSGNKRTDDTLYGVYIWQKGWRGETTLRWM